MKPSLINNIHLTEVLDLLLEKEIINTEDQSQIEAADKKSGSIQAVRVMLEKVDKRVPNWYIEFHDVLNEAGMSKIAEAFKMIEHHEHVTHDGKFFNLYHAECLKCEIILPIFLALSIMSFRDIKMKT